MHPFVSESLRLPTRYSRSMPTYHPTLAAGRWHTFTIDEQLGNTGSEVHRVITALARGDARAADGAFARGIELFNLTLDDTRWGFHRKREIARTRDLFCEAVTGTTSDTATLSWLDAHLTQFAYAARKDHR